MTGYFTELEHELVAAAGRQRPTASPSPAIIPTRRQRHRLRIALIATGLLVIAGAPAAAVTGIFKPHREPDGLVRLSQRQVIAEGSTPDHGRWQLLASESDAGFCFGIRLPLPDLHEEQGSTSVSEGCGGSRPGTLTVATVSGGSVPRNGLALGMAPDRATHVRIQARGVTVTVETIDDNAGLAGRFYVAELPIRTSLGPTTVTALDSAGHAIAKTT